MKRLFAAAVATVLFSGISLTAATGQTARPAPTARQLALAHEILDANGVSANYEVVLRNMFNGIAKRDSSGTPESRAIVDGLTARITQAISQLKPKMLDTAAEAYAETFTDEELTQILAFYRSPGGQAMARKMPDLSRRMGEQTAVLLPEIMKAMTAESVQSPPKS